MSEAFLLTKRLSGCTEATLVTYRWWLERLCAFLGPEEPSPARVVEFFSTLEGKSSSHRHQAYRTLRTFFRWAVSIGEIVQDPLAGFRLRTPKTLPRVPTDDELRQVLRCCPDTFEGLRNRTIILVLADSGLRAQELLRLLVQDWNPAERSLFVRAGKGQKDRVVFVGPTTARSLRAWLATHPRPAPEEHLFCDRRGRPIKARHLVQILHRLSQRAGLPRERWLHPHALRHYCATGLLRHGADLEAVRRLLGHSTLNMVLRYAHLVGRDVQQAHRRAAHLERLDLR
ncbi:MAG: tyrosine-type recombinase/integrase [Armatimonadota bacterium]|nr:tyrosine-type recombinase/integrase [Armatimonadota bacterium]MDR7443476.1 tyrosine-type recombinase/integrase [Armatimonadota bacterium]MDR7569314.1 tyrosine-type recombinase/integrase [Armatimonadota bacterium]MDR7614974.1 tyrosine-type recombinase/integrase [Armatimonadota bacterium]